MAYSKSTARAPASPGLYELACELSGRYHDSMRALWLPAMRGLDRAGPNGSVRSPEQAAARIGALTHALRTLEWNGLHLDDPRHPASFHAALRCLQALPEGLEGEGRPLHQIMAALLRSARAIHGQLAAIDSARLELVRSRRCARCSGRLVSAEGEPACIACGWSPGSGRTATAAERAEMMGRRRAPRMPAAGTSQPPAHYLALTSETSGRITAAMNNSPREPAPAGTTNDATPSCRHCPDCPRRAEHRLGTAWYCAPCLVVFLDWLEHEARPESPLLHQARKLVAAICTEDSKGYAVLGSEGARACHIYGWGERPRRPQPWPPGALAPPAGWAGLIAFYAERGGLRSEEADYGGRNRGAGAAGRHCSWRISVVASTGDLYAAAACSCDTHPQVLLLGGVEPDPQWRDADRRFEGWADELRDLEWFRRRAAAPQPVQQPLLPLPHIAPP